MERGTKGVTKALVAQQLVMVLRVNRADLSISHLIASFIPDLFASVVTGKLKCLTFSPHWSWEEL